MSHHLNPSSEVESSSAELSTWSADASFVAEGSAFATIRRPSLQSAEAGGLPVEQEFPLASGQKAMWFMYQMDPSGSAYNIVDAVRVRGLLDTDALRRSLQKLYDRHASLRTTVYENQGEPRQRVHLGGTMPLEIIEAYGWSEQRWRQRLSEETHRPFDLTRGPLARTILLRLSVTESVFAFVLHHIIADVWSVVVCVGEFRALYETETEGRLLALPPHDATFADMVHRQNELISSPQGRKLADYWRTELAGEPPPLDLPTDHPRPAVQTYRGDQEFLTVDARITAGLKELSKEHRATLFMTLMAAYHVWIFRHTNQPDVLVGTVVAGRSRPEFAGVVGDFVNSVVIRSDLAGNPWFVDVVKQVREKTLKAFDHQEYPFPALVEALQPQRDASRTPIFQTMLVMQRAQVGNKTLSQFMTGQASASMSLGATTMEAVQIEQHDAQFDVMVYAAEAGDQLNLQFQYNTDLFDRTTMQRMVARFGELLKSIVADPARSIGRLSILPETEREWLTEGLNDCEREVPQATVSQLFERQVDERPDAPLIITDEEEVSFAEVNRRANRFATRLRELGVGVESLVGVGLERTASMVAVLLGIFKIGAAYVPLDPTFPRERLAYMLESARPAVLVTERAVQDKLPAYAGRTLYLDEEAELIAKLPETNVVANLDPENLAYVLYTSGSTGKPKGVEIEQRAIVNMLYGMARKPGFTADDVVLAFTTLSFDLSVYELFMPAVMGGGLVLANSTQARDGAWLAAAVRRHGVTVLQATPSTFRLLVASGWSGEPGVKVLTGGEALPRDLAEQLLPRCRELWNCYGPTETTVWTHRYLVTSPDDITLGDQFENITCYVLDDLMELLPTGVAGELWIGGTGVARGYRDRDDLTSDKFFRNPYRPGDRIYRSGDVIRRKADGRQVFVGRADHQVKIRGFRIELGEIESVLAVQPGVRTCLVHVHRKDDPQLVAYVQPAEPQADAIALQAGLRAKLPEYMIPTAFVFLPEFPRTPNGKIDRKSLPGPQAVGDDTAFVAPRTPTEWTVAELWREVLEVERVGAGDDFFALGGHSLKAAQLSANVRERFGVALPLRAMFADPTVSGVASEIDRLLRVGTGSEVCDDDAPAATTVSGGESAAEAVSTNGRKFAHIEIEPRPPLSLFAAGKLSPVDTAALAYLPSSLLEHTGLSADEAVAFACQDMPLVAGIQNTSLGRSVAILLPRFDYQLYRDRADLIERAIEGLRMAKHLGARMVSLTGLLPSATDYGRDLAKAIVDLDLPPFTTGHATTTAAVVLSIRQAHRLAGRDVAQETIGFLGLGSIGTATLRLMLTRLRHPAELMLCDVFAKREGLERLADEARTRFGYRGRIAILSSGAAVPDELYAARTIVGATNVAEILDVAKLRPGAIIVDDSAPHCFSVATAWRRFEEQGDILFTEGGVLTAPTAIRQTAFVPASIAAALDIDPASLLAQSEPRHITGCILSSGLTLADPSLSPSVGEVDEAESVRHFEKLLTLGYDAGALHCDGRRLDPAIIAAFKDRYSPFS